MRTRRGFSLLELLFVLALLSLVLTLGVVSLLDAAHAARVREGAAQLAADLQTARTLAQTRGQDAGVLLEVAHNRYTVSSPQGQRVQTLPAGVALAVEGPAGIHYSAPHGELRGVVPSRIRLYYAPKARIAPRYVKVLGVTGKVIVSANE